MNFIPLVLGLLLSIAGCVSIISGYDIITIERGWTEVIAGTTALSGGVITLSLWAILQRLTAFSKAFQAKPVAEPAINLFEAAPAPPADFGFAHPDNLASAASTIPLQSMIPSLQGMTPSQGMTPPLQGMTPGASLTAAQILTPSIETPIEPVAPSIEATADSAKFTSDEAAFEAALLNDEIEAAVLSATNKPSNRFAFKKTKELPRLTPSLFGNRPADAAVEPSVIEAAAPIFHEPEPLTPQSAPLTPAQSLDEVWQRVSEEIEKPILTEETVAFTSRTKRFETADMTPFEHAPNHSPEFEHRTEEVPSHDEEAPAHDSFASASTQGYAAAQVTESVATQELPHAAEVPSNPTVIGSYEADGTTYIMYADGSIDARSEAGIYHFTSMAHLKSFIEDKQAAPAEA